MTARACLLACLVPLALTGTACDIGVAAVGEEATFDRNLTVSGPVELDVMSGSGDIRVRTGPAGSIQIHGRARTHNGAWISFDGETGADTLRRIVKEPPIEQTGNRVRVGPREWTDRWNGVSISYLITAPADTKLLVRSGSGDLEVGDVAGPVDAGTGSGDIRVGRTTNAVLLRTGSGSIEVVGAGSVVARTGSGSVLASSVSGDVEASSGSGDITVTQVAKGRTEVSTGSGDITLSGANGAVRARASSGDVSVEGTPSAPWDVSASSGDVRMRMTADAAFDLEVRSGSGGIDTALPVTTTGSQSRRELRGQVRGGGPRVHVTTGSGSISLR